MSTVLGTEAPPRGEARRERRRGIEPLDRPTLAEAVAERLRELVVAGTYPEGAQLGESELAERFGVSRGPVREGLQILVQDGLLVRRRHRGVFMPIATDDDLADIYTAREALEGCALRIVLRASASASERAQLVESLRRLVSEMRAAAANARWARVADLDMSFHRAVVASARSPRLLRMYATLTQEMRAVLGMTASVSQRATLVDEHAGLVELIDRGEVDRVTDELARHFRQSVATLHRRRARGAAPRGKERPR